MAAGAGAAFGLRVLRLLPPAAFLAGLGAALWVVWLPDVEPLKNRAPATTAYIELRKKQAAAKGRKLDLRWTWVASEAISENLKRAVVTAEDDEFWRHDGVDLTAIRAAYARNRKAGRFAAGGSTITMQLARNLYLSPSKNPLRKAKEILIALRLERKLGKRRILEIYLNVVEWGENVFGCEAAARAYFGKSCADLSSEEAVAMAVVLPNPRRWDPSKRGVYVERNSKRIIDRMTAVDRARTEDDKPIIEPGIQSASTTVNSSTGSSPGEYGRNPLILE
ncbi:MAG: monofunctional biosynthetic peptidoglycan transglycosylase [Elusimicrobiota bacterium]